MHIRHLFFLLTMPVCCFAETGKSPVRDYKMVDLRNRLTTELLAVGPTSITIYVEWPLDMAPYGEWACFNLMGKLDIEERGWYDLADVMTDQTLGKATFEIPYSQFTWYNWEGWDFSQKAWFAIRVPAPTDAVVGVGFRGMYEEDDEIDDEEFERAQKEALEEFYGEVAEGDSASPELRAAYERIKAEDRKAAEELMAKMYPTSREGESGIGKEGIEIESKKNHLWLYASILLGICAAFYFVRRKLKTGN